MKGMGEAVMLTMAQMGLKLVNQIETQESLEIWVTVPETSYEVDVDGIQMAGMHLAKRYKETLEMLGLKRLTVKAKIRKGDHWTKEKSEAANLEMRKMIYGSQY